MTRAFISYRRDDTAQIAQALYLQLKELFGSDQLFMDVNSIRTGEAWPARIKQRLEDATVLLALIGPGWLHATDKKGRRRILDRTDWVRNEILYALRHRIKVIPVAINHTKNLPSRADLPRELRALRNKQAMVLRVAAEWGRDVRALSEVLVDLGFSRNELEDQPTPSKDIQRNFRALTERQLAALPKEIPEWEQWGESLALEFPRIRRELRRTFDFASFAEAMKFMDRIAPLFDKREPPHHPRWGNDWKKVRIRLTTWDVGNKITRLDVDTAKMVDAEYEKFKGRA